MKQNNIKISSLINKCLNCVVQNEELTFTEEEKEFIVKNIKIYSSIEDESDEEVIKFIHLITNIKNNLDDETIEYLRNIISIPYMYFTDKDIHNYTLYGIKVGKLSDMTKKVDDKSLTFEQDKIYKSFESEFNIFLKAKTGFGKTFLSTTYLIDSYKKYGLNNNKKFIFIVPTELLETQIIEDLHNRFNDFSNAIGNDIQLNNIFIGTWEKLACVISEKEVIIDIDTLIIDEAHYIGYYDERSLFLNHIIKTYFKKKSTRKIILLSPFEISNNVLDETFNYKSFIYLNLQSSKRPNKWSLTDLMMSEKWNKTKYDNFIQNNTHFVTCILTSTKPKAKKKAKNLSITKDLIQKIKSSIEADPLVDQEEYKKELENLDKEFSHLNDKYLILDYIKGGICYLTADVPDSVKKKIISLVNKRMIRIVISTSLIISGIDLPFDVTLAESNKINKNDILPNELINYFGRAGRIGKKKKAYGLGFCAIKIDKEDKKTWWDKNKNEILSKLNNNNFEDDKRVIENNDLAIKLSIEKYNETNNLIYVYEPRIFPNITDYIFSLNITDTDYYSILKMIFNKDRFNPHLEILIITIFRIYDINKSSKGDYPEDLSKHFKLYKVDSFKNLFEESNEKKNLLYKNSDFKWNIINTKIYIENNFSIEEGLVKYVSQNWLRGKNKTYITKHIETYISTAKDFGKFYFMMFLNHLYLMIQKESKYNNITIISHTNIFNKEFYNYISDKKYFVELLNKIKENDDLKNEWREINSIDNDIYKIYYAIKKNNRTSSLLNEISNNQFLGDFEEYLLTVNIKND